MKINFKETKKPRIEMIPLIDVIFLLLVFFIYTMLSMAVHKGLKVSLPESSHAKISKDDALCITIKSDGSIFIDKTSVSMNELKTVLKRKNNSENRLKIELFADKDVKYDNVFSVLNIIKDVGINDISLQAESEK